MANVQFSETSLQNSAQESQFGTWRNHTRGVEMKIMQGVGFQKGKGLGEKGQGITKPIAVTKDEVTYSDLRHALDSVDIPDAENHAYVFSSSPCNCSSTDKPIDLEEETKQHPRMRSVENQMRKPLSRVLKKKKLLPPNEDYASCKVINMVGEIPTVTTGYKSVSVYHIDTQSIDSRKVVLETLTRESDVMMPELIHSLNLCVQLTEEELIQKQHQVKYDEDKMKRLCLKKKKLYNMCENEQISKEKLKQWLEQTDQKKQLKQVVNVTLVDVAALFRDLEGDTLEQTKTNLGQLAFAVVFPLIQKHFANWNVQECPQFGLDVIEEWKGLLKGKRLQIQNKKIDLYEKLIWDIWLPHVRRAVLDWDIQTGRCLAELMHVWTPLLTPMVKGHIFDQLVLPKLQKAIEDWDPVATGTLVEEWFHPWIPLLSEKLECLHAPIRHKLAKALVDWHPCGDSARKLVWPWLNVFRPKEMENFLVKNITPKLELCLQQMEINNQYEVKATPLAWVMAWNDIIHDSHLVRLMLDSFFPNWLHVLHTWLCSSPNFDEVSRWYLGWKAQIPDKFLLQARVNEMLKKALIMMDCAVSGRGPPFPEAKNHFLGGEADDFHESKESSDTAGQFKLCVQTAGFTYPENFKELVEKRAEEKNILFTPLVGKNHELKQVYRFGKEQIYIDRNVVFVFVGNEWKPVSLEKLLLVGTSE